MPFIPKDTKMTDKRRCYDIWPLEFERLRGNLTTCNAARVTDCVTHLTKPVTG